MSEKVIHASRPVDIVLWLDVQFSPKHPGNGDSKVPEISGHYYVMTL